MLSTAADVAQLASAAPWLAVGALSLVAAAWVYRQSRRAVRVAEDRCARSAARQGERLGKLEKTAGLLDLRRRQVEWTLLELGVELPPWPPDGPPPARRRRDDEDQGDVFVEPNATEVRRVPVPPLPDGVGARHRREPARTPGDY